MKRIAVTAALLLALVIPGLCSGREAPTVVGITPSPTPSATLRPTPVVVGIPPVSPTPAPTSQPVPMRTLPPTDTE